MINTNSEHQKRIYTLQQKSGELTFSIDTPQNFLPSSQTFTVLTIDSECYNNKIGPLFRQLIDMSYNFEPIGETYGDKAFKGYCIYGISFDEAMRIGEFSSHNTILYSDQNHIGYYDKATHALIQKFIFA